jgi:hypothetical protein
VTRSAPHSYPLAPHYGPAPFVLAGVAGFVALGIAVHHPLLVLLGGAFLFGKAARRHRWRRWHHESHRGSHGSGERTRRPFVRSFEARRAYEAARAAVETTEVLPKEEKAELISKLETGFEQVAALETARRRIGGIDDDRLRDVADRAAERTAQFVADCDRLRTSVAALEVQGKDTAGLDELARATEALTSRIAAQKEVDDLEQ